MQLKAAVLLAVLALFSLPVAAQTTIEPEASANFTGNVQKTTSGFGITDTASKAGGFLINYRRHFRFLPHQGFVEVNGAFTTFTQYYQPGSSLTQSNIYEASGAYVVPFWTNDNERHFKPFVEAGGGATMFTVVSTGSVAGARRQIRPAIVYGGGVDYRKGSHFAFRLGYRGLFYRAPDYGLASQLTDAVTHMAEPYIGIVYRF